MALTSRYGACSFTTTCLGRTRGVSRCRHALDRRAPNDSLCKGNSTRQARPIGPRSLSRFPLAPRRSSGPPPDTAPPLPPTSRSTRLRLRKTPRPSSAFPHRALLVLVSLTADAPRTGLDLVGFFPVLAIACLCQYERCFVVISDRPPSLRARTTVQSANRPLDRRSLDPHADGNNERCTIDVLQDTVLDVDEFSVETCGSPRPCFRRLGRPFTHATEPVPSTTHPNTHAHIHQSTTSLRYLGIASRGQIRRMVWWCRLERQSAGPPMVASSFPGSLYVSTLLPVPCRSIFFSPLKS